MKQNYSSHMTLLSRTLFWKYTTFLHVPIYSHCITESSVWGQPGRKVELSNSLFRSLCIKLANLIIKAALTSHFLCIFLWNNQRIYSQLLQQHKDPVHVCQETWSTFRPGRGRLMLRRSPRQRRSSVEGSVSRQQVHYQGYLLYGCNEHIL